MARFNEATAKMEAELHVAKREAANARDRFRAEAAAHRNTVVEKTTGEARQYIAEAETEVTQDVVEARAKLAGEADSLAAAAAERILGRAV